jgi:hypothetical protein
VLACPELKLPTGTISDLFDLSIENDQLVVTPKLSSTDGQMRCTIKGLAGPCTVGIFADKNAPGGGINALQFAHRDFSNPMEIFRHTMLFAHARSVQLSMDLDGLVRSKSCSLIQDIKPDDPNAAIRLNAQLIDAISDDVIGQYNVSAANFRELRIKYPRETQEFVVPILRDLQAESILAPDNRIAAQVLGLEVKPNEALSKKLSAALAKFDSDNFQEREQAAKDLAALGEPVAAVLRHADRAGWSLDRQSGVDDFLAQHKSMPQDESSKLREQPIFLLDCLHSSDKEIQNKAADLLDKMSQMKIDLRGTIVARDAMIDRLYAKLFPPLTTQPTSRRQD